jgi:predicted enzyme related to lactoylglutathione lyase
VIAPMPAGSPHISATGGTWSINFRVDSLDAMVEQLRSAGIAVDIDPESYPNGRFAALADPEGNAIQLWQPEGADS